MFQHFACTHVHPIPLVTMSPMSTRRPIRHSAVGWEGGHQLEAKQGIAALEVCQGPQIGGFGIPIGALVSHW